MKSCCQLSIFKFVRSNWLVSLAARECKGMLYLYAAEYRKRYHVSVDDG